MTYQIYYPESEDVNFEISYPTKKEYESEKIKDIGKQSILGTLLGPGAYGNILDLIRAQPKNELLPGQEVLYKTEFEAPEKYLPYYQEEDVVPLYSKLASSKGIENFLQRLGIDTEPYTQSGKTARRITQGASAAAATLPIPNAIVAGAVGGAAGGLTEELTGSPLYGDVAEITTNILGLLKGGPAGAGSRGQKISALKNLGFEADEIALLSQGEGKLNFLGKLASKDAKMENLFSKIYKTHGNLYDGLREASKDFGYLSGEKGENFLTNLEKVFSDLTPGQQEVAQKLTEEFSTKPFSFKSMMDYIQDLNMKYGTLKGGKKAVLKLKEPVIDAMYELNPEAAGVFDELQSSYGNFKKIAKSLKPGTLDDLLDAGEMFALGKGLIEKDGGIIQKILGFAGARKLAREYLINPDLQGIILRIAKATNEGKTQLAESLARKLPKYLPKEISQEEIMAEQ